MKLEIPKNSKKDADGNYLVTWYSIDGTEKCFGVLLDTKPVLNAYAVRVTTEPGSSLKGMIVLLKPEFFQFIPDKKLPAPYVKVSRDAGKKLVHITMDTTTARVITCILGSQLGDGPRGLDMLFGELAAEFYSNSGTSADSRRLEIQNWSMNSAAIKNDFDHWKE